MYGVLLKRARDRGNLTQAEAARLVGLTREAVSRHEAGSRIPRYRALESYLRNLPGLTPSALLLREPKTPPAHWESFWRYQRELYGLFADRMIWRIDGRWLKVTVSGLRATHAPMNDPLVREELLRVACHGGPEVKRQLHVDIDRIVDGNCQHFFAWKPDGLTYQARMPRDRTEASVALDVPVRQLDVACRSDRGEGFPVFRAWPASRPESEPDVARYLYPGGGLLKARARVATVRLLRPLVGLRYRVAWEQDPGRDPTALGSLGETLREARQRARLSRRKLATMLDLSPATIDRAERDVASLEVLQRYHDAPLDIAAQDILPTPPKDIDLTDADAWEYARHLFGFEAEEVEKSVTIAADGTANVRVETRRLAALHADVRDLAIRHGIQRVVSQNAPSVLQAIESDEDARVRVLRGEDGSVHHEMRFRGRGDFDYQRTFAGPRFVLHDRIARTHFPDDPYFTEGTDYEAFFPVRRLVLRVVWPNGYQPTEVAGGIGPSCVMPDDERPTISPRPAPLAVVSGGECRLAIERPLPWMRYSLSWRLP